MGTKPLMHSFQRRVDHNSKSKVTTAKRTFVDFGSHQPIRRRLQINQICSALRFAPCRGLQHIQCSTALDQPSEVIGGDCNADVERSW
jgi:hypothetical protein